MGGSDVYIYPSTPAAVLLVSRGRSSFSRATWPSLPAMLLGRRHSMRVRPVAWGANMGREAAMYMLHGASLTSLLGDVKV